jgi:hypothetical protein
MTPHNSGAANSAALRIDWREGHALGIGEIRLRQLPQRGFPLDRKWRERREGYDLLVPKA